MSISTALGNAYSGLVATSRAADLASNNIANALTPGYARRSLALSSTVLGGYGYGVGIDGTTRSVSPRAIADRRLADAADGRAAMLADGAARIAQAFGTPGAEGALSTRVAAFERALELARDTPESEAARAGLLAAAKDLARGFNAVSREVRSVREEAEQSIETQVATVNGALSRIEDINRAVRMRAGTGEDVTALLDERDRLVDEVNRVVPVRIAARDKGEIALFTPGGASLLDGRAAVLSFTATGSFTAAETVGAGLGTVSLDGMPVDMGTSGKLAGGTLSAAFDLRDRTGPAADTRLDALAADLVQRLEAVDTDAGGAGLFTDGGAAFNPLAQAGLAGRLAVNAAVDPDQGGALWRLRDGLSAVAEGLAADDTLLTAMADAVGARTAVPAATGLSGALDIAGMADGLSALVLAEGSRAEDDAAFRAGQLVTMREAELSVSAVDTDAELQRLLKIETTYAANAKVIETVDFLWRRLMEI